MSLVIERTLRLIQLVSEGNQSLAGLIATSRLSRSTTHRLLSTLVANGYLPYGQKRYELGFRFLEIGEKKKRSLAFIEHLHMILQNHVDQLEDAIHLAILDGTDIILVDRVPGNRELQIRSHVGQPYAGVQNGCGQGADWTATGK